MSFFRFDHPELLSLGLLAIPIVYLGLRSLATLEPYRRWAAITVRVAVLTVLVLMLSGLQTVQHHSDLTVIAIVDESASIRHFAPPLGSFPRAPGSPGASGRPERVSGSAEKTSGGTGATSGGGSIRGYLRAAAAGDRRPDDRFGWITFQGRAQVRSLPQLGDPSLDAAAIEQPAEGTNAADGLRFGLALFPADSGDRALLVSDGNFDDPDAVRTVAQEYASAGIPIDVLPILYRVDNEVMVDGIFAPTEAREGQTVAVRVVLRGTRPAQGLLQMIHDDQALDLNGPDTPGTGLFIAPTDWSTPPPEVASAPPETPPARPDAPGPPVAQEKTSGGAGETSGGGEYVLAKQIDLVLPYSGVNKFTAVFEPDGGDRLAVNNRAQTFTRVDGQGRILLVDGVGGASGQILPQALGSHGLNLDVVPPRSMPGSLARLSDYDAVIFQNVSADQITGPRQKALTRYVHDLGGGFVMVGGPDSFGAGAWTNTDLDKYILPVSCQIPSQTVLPSGALVLVLDRSGSMASSVAGTPKTQQELANEAAVLALATLYPQDKVGVVAFDSGAQWIAKLDWNSDPKGVARKVRSIHPQGGTNIYSGLKDAFDALASLTMADAAVKHVILLTDGQSTAPPGSGGYVKLIGMMAAHDITLSTIGVGDGHDAALLHQLATMGGGQYHPIHNPANLPQVFIKEAKIVRKNLIKEEPFVPRLTGSVSPITEGIAALPTLKGLVLTGPKHDPRIFQPIEGPNGEPVFAHWQVGLGRAAAFTSDATNKWATDWLGWAGYADFWTRTLRQIARPTPSRQADLTTTIVGDRLKIRLDTAGFEDTGDGFGGLSGGLSGGASGGGRAGATSGGGGHFMTVQGAVLRPGAGDQTEPITLTQTGPGLYEADLPATESGNYIVYLAATGPDGQRRAILGGASRAPGGELRRFASNFTALQEIADLTGGRILDPHQPARAGLFSRQGFDLADQPRTIRPLWRTLGLCLLALFLLDVANRRIAWDPVAIVAAVRKTAGSMVLKTRGDQATHTLGRLRQTRPPGSFPRATDPAPGSANPPGPAPAPPPDRARKFDAPEGAVAGASFAEAVGGAREDGSSRTRITAAMHKQKTAADPDAAGTPATTSRLLDAKRRAREQMEKED